MSATSPLHVGLLASDLSERHGWAAYSLNLARALLAAGVRLTIVTATNSPVVEGVGALPLLPAVEPRASGFMLKLARAMPATRAALQSCAVVHAAIEPYAPLGALLAGSRPLFVTGHGSYVQPDQAWRPPLNALYRWAFRRSRMICVSRYTARVARSAVPGLQATVINNGVNAARFAHLPPPDTVLSGPTTGPIILSVGAVKARKGTLELVQAMAAVHEQRPAARCVIAGSLTAEPAYVARVRDEIRALGLESVVDLLGHVPDQTLLAWYGAAQVFVLPSLNDGWKFEGYGLTLIEASAAGLPVIGTTGCGAEDAVDDGVTGLLVPQQGLAGALPPAILRLLDDPDLAARMGAAGREKARRQSWDRVARQMLALYTDNITDNIE